MAKKIVLAAVAVAFLGLVSCKKDYTCACTDADGTFNYSYNKVKKKDAESACNSMNTLWATDGGSCKLK